MKLAQLAVAVAAAFSLSALAAGEQEQKQEPQAQGSGQSTQSQSSQQASSQTPELVKQAQEKLSSAGHDAGPADGKMGPKTQAALKEFQQSKGLQASGQLDQKTAAALGVSSGGSASSGASSDKSASSGASSAKSSEKPKY